ncbi:hypothetical protein ACIF8T_03755 [Streptomyces sp. NPDC085946]|uniref:hypothetical protein n=1 Tax=Streptomyces sp. NPDC085946 TaxID=3365744 RepID=UPI0037D89790
MAEHDSDREDREPDEKGAPLDEEAAWAAIVAGYGEEPPDPPGAKPFKSVEDLALLEAETNDDRTGSDDGGAGTGTGTVVDDDGPGAGSEGDEPGTARPLGSSVAFAPGVGTGRAAGPRDYTTAEPSDEDLDADDEGHFVPPEPPPLPEADATAKFAWLGVLGAPVLLLLAVLLGWDMTWWLATLCIGGFLGGIAALVLRMKPDDEDDDDPGRGAVV